MHAVVELERPKIAVLLGHLAPPPEIDELLRAIKAEAVSPTIIELDPTQAALFSGRKQLLHFVLDGTAVVELPHSKTFRSVQAGDIVLIPHRQMHRLRTAEGARCVGIENATLPVDDGVRLLRSASHPDARILSCLFDLSHAVANPLVRMMPDIVVDRLPMVDMIRQSRHTPGMAALAGRIADLSVMEMLRREMLRSGMLERPGSIGAGMAPIERCVAAIRSEPGRSWSVRELAQKGGMSRSAFAAAFARYIGEPPMRYLARARLDRAAEILRTTNLDAAAIAKLVGYKSGAALTRAFRRQFGTPPGQYRRRPAGPEAIAAHA